MSGMSAVPGLAHEGSCDVCTARDRGHVAARAGAGTLTNVNSRPTPKPEQGTTDDHLIFPAGTPVLVRCLVYVLCAVAAVCTVAPFAFHLGAYDFLFPDAGWTGGGLYRFGQDGVWWLLLGYPGAFALAGVTIGVSQRVRGRGAGRAFRDGAQATGRLIILPVLIGLQLLG